MAEFQEVMKQFKRMCNYHSRDKNQKSCPLCLSYPNCNIGQCRKIAFCEPEAFELKVTAWAAKHPEPRVPTWGEYLCDIGLIGDCTEAEDAIARLFNNTISPDTAEKLGITPKER